MARKPAGRAPGGIEPRSRRTGNPFWGTALLQLRRRSGWTQTRLELATRLSRGTLSLYETGKRSLARPLFDRLANSMGLSIEDVDRTLAALAGISAAEVQPPSSPASLLPHEHQAVEAAAERAARRAAEIVRRGVGTRLIEARLRSERTEAANLWEELRRLPTFRECLSRIHMDSRFRSWALCERLCEKSVSAAHHDVPASQGLARLALKIAERVPGGDAWRCRVQGYAWAFVANSLRVGEKLPAAEEAMARSAESWHAGAEVASAPLDGSRVLNVNSSLHRAQGRLHEAELSLHAAMQVADDALKLRRLKVSLINLLTVKKSYQESIEMLAGLREDVAVGNAPYMKLQLKHLEAHCRGGLGQIDEAIRLAGQAMNLVLELGTALDALRVRWFWAVLNVQGGRSSKSEAVVQLREIRQAFLLRNLELDANRVLQTIAELQQG